MLRPSLWNTAIRQWRAALGQKWWSVPPHLPVPDGAYLRFRLQTHYGGSGVVGQVEPHDVVAYLQWCRAWHRSGQIQQ